MKNVRLVLGLTVLAAIGFVSCEKSETIPVDSVEGTYVGTITLDDGLKSGISFDATAEVSEMGDGEIEVHCFGGEMDTTFMLNHYENGDSIMVCLTDSAFANMYGHTMGEGGMMGNGNGGMMGGNSEWMDHMNGEHHEGDEHFGGFDMNNRTFGYTIKRNSGDYHFQGTKK